MLNVSRKMKTAVLLKDTGKGIPQEDIERIFDPLHNAGKGGRIRASIK